MKPTLEEIFGKKTTIPTRRPLSEIFGIQEKKPTGSETVGDIKETGTAIADSFRERLGNAQASVKGLMNGEQDVFQTARQLQGQAAGGASDIIADTATGLGKAVLPQIAEDKLASNFQAGIEKSDIPKILNSDPVQSIMSKYEQLKQTNPALARDIDAALGVGALALDVTGAGVGGKAIKPVGTAIKEGVESSAKAVAKGAGEVADVAKNIGPKFAENLTKLDPKVQTIVKETPVDVVKKYVTLGEEAVNDPRKLTPLEVAGQKAKTTLDELGIKMNARGKEISDILKTKGDITKVGSIASEARTKLRQRLFDDLGGIINEKGAVKNAPNRTLKFSDATDKKLIQDTDSILARLGENPSLRQVDDAISSIDDALFKRKSLTAVPVNSQVEASLKEIVGELNTKVKGIAGKEYTLAKKDYSRIKTIHSALNKALGADGNKGGVLFKKFFSPSDAGTKKLFDAIRSELGIDLSQDAVTAKAVMDILGDARSKSLLEGGIPTSASGAAMKAVNYLTDKVAGKTMQSAKLRNLVKGAKID